MWKAITKNSLWEIHLHVTFFLGNLVIAFLTIIFFGKDRNGMDLTEAEDIKKKWQEYTEKLYKKDIKDQITTMVWSLTLSQIFWSTKSSGPYEAALWTKLVEEIEFQLSYFKS